MDGYPPEFNLIFMLWLTLPQFNGIEMINKRIIQPFYEKHEHTIDEIVQEVSDWMKDFAVRHSKDILYQLLLSKDGIAVSMLSNISKFISFIDGFDSKNVTASFKSLKLGQKILSDFTAIMQEGIMMRAGMDMAHLRFINCSIHDKNSCYFALKALDDDSTYLLPILLIKSMDMYDESEHGRESIQLTFYKDIMIHGDVNDIHTSPSRGLRVRSIYLDLPEDDCDGFVGGVQVYSTSVKTRSLRKLDRMIQALQRLHYKIKFRHWKMMMTASSSWVDDMGGSLKALSLPFQFNDWNVKK